MTRRSPATSSTRLPSTAWSDRAPSAGPGLDEARLVRGDHGLHAIAGVELAEDPPDMGLHRRLAEVELAGDLTVRHAPRHQAQHLDLALGQTVEAGDGAWIGSA